MNPDERPVHWNLPTWAAELIRETIEMDSRSPAFDHELRHRLSEALGAIEEVNLPRSKK